LLISTETGSAFGSLISELRAKRYNAPVGFVRRGTFVAPLHSFLRERFTLIKEFPHGERIFSSLRKHARKLISAL
jgi:hypothetical protein